jgi:hypothetical protein
MPWRAQATAPLGVACDRFEGRRSRWQRPRKHRLRFWPTSELPWQASPGWLHNLRRLRIRYERLPELHQAFLVLGCAVVCVRVLAGGDEPGLAASAESTTTGSR